VRRALRSVAESLARAALELAAFTILAALALIAYSVAMRYFLGRPQSWVEPVVGWLVVALVMLGAPAAQLRGEHIGVELLLDRARGLARHALILFGVLAVAATALIVLDQGLAMVAFSRMTGETANDFPGIAMWWIRVLVPVGGALLLAVAVLQILRYLLGERDAIPREGGKHE
jgi:TRAP-type C4-dicarboxylate transport system permease small subunit